MSLMRPEKSPGWVEVLKHCLCTRTWPRTLPNLLVILGLPPGCPYLRLHREDPILGSLTRWLAGFSSSGVVGSRSLPRVPVTWASPQSVSPRGSWFHQSEQEGKRETVDEQEVLVFCNLILEVTSCHFCHSLFTRSKPVGAAHTQREEPRQGGEYGRRGAWGTLSEAACHRTLSWAGQTWHQSHWDLLGLPLPAHRSVPPWRF